MMGYKSNFYLAVDESVHNEKLFSMAQVCST